LSDAPGANIPTQSVLLGDGIPPQLTVKLPPETTLLGLPTRVTPGTGVTLGVDVLVGVRVTVGVGVFNGVFVGDGVTGVGVVDGVIGVPVAVGPEEIFTSTLST